MPKTNSNKVRDALSKNNSEMSSLGIRNDSSLNIQSPYNIYNKTTLCWNQGGNEIKAIIFQENRNQNTPVVCYNEKDSHLWIKWIQYWSEVLAGGKTWPLSLDWCSYLQNILLSRTEARTSVYVHVYLYIEHINNFKGEIHMK